MLEPTIPLGEIHHTGPKLLPEQGVVFSAEIASKAGGMAIESSKGADVDSLDVTDDLICTD